MAANALARAAEAGGFDDVLELAPDTRTLAGMGVRVSGASLQARADKIRERVKDLIGFLDDVRWFIEEARTVAHWAGGPGSMVVRKASIAFSVGGYDGR